MREKVREGAKEEVREGVREEVREEVREGVREEVREGLREEGVREEGGTFPNTRPDRGLLVVDEDCRAGKTRGGLEVV